MRVDSASNSGSSLEMSSTALPSDASWSIQACSSALAPTSTPRVGSSRMRTSLSPGEPLRHHDLLLIAAGQRCDRRVHLGAHLESGELGRDRAPFAASVDPTGAGDRPQHRQGHVGSGGHRQDEAESLPIFRDEADPEAHGVARRPNDASFAANGNRPAGGAVEAEDRIGDLRPSRADEPGEPEHLSGANGEGDIRELPIRRERVDAQDLRALGPSGVRGKIIDDRTPDHLLNQRRFVERRCRLGGHVPTIAQHRNFVTESKDLRHAVRHVEQRRAPRLQLGDQLVQPIGVVLIETARRLVEDDDLRSLADGRGDLRELLFGGRERAHRPSGIDRRADGGKELARPDLTGRSIDHRAMPRQRAEAEILGDGQVLAERELLMDHRDARATRIARRRQRERASGDLDRSTVGALDAGEDLSERALAGAVLSAHRVTGAGANVEADVGERLNAAESLRDSGEPDHPNASGQAPDTSDRRR